jgi:hypothetical protein
MLLPAHIFPPPCTHRIQSILLKLDEHCRHEGHILQTQPFNYAAADPTTGEQVSRILHVFPVHWPFVPITCVCVCVCLCVCHLTLPGMLLGATIRLSSAGMVALRRCYSRSRRCSSVENHRNIWAHLPSGVCVSGCVRVILACYITKRHSYIICRIVRHCVMRNSKAGVCVCVCVCVRACVRMCVCVRALRVR